MREVALEERFAELDRMPRQLAAIAARFTPGETQRRTAAGGFSLIEQVCHLTDVEERAFAVRIGRIRAEASPALSDFDGAAAAVDGHYQRRALAPALAAFSAARARSLARLRAVRIEEWPRPAHLEGVGALTLADLPRLMAAHDAAHRRELDALRAEILCEVLATAPARVRALLGEFSAAALRRPPASAPVDAEALSAIGHACHLRDIELDGYHLRIRRTCTEANPLLPSLPGEQLAIARAYDAADPEAALRAFERARQQTLAMLRDVGMLEWARTADFEGYGPVTLLGIIEILAGHDRAHLAALAGMPHSVR